MKQYISIKSTNNYNTTIGTQNMRKTAQNTCFQTTQKCTWRFHHRRSALPIACTNT